MAGQRTFFGGTITFGTSTVVSKGFITSLGRSGATTEDIDISHMSTSGNNREFIPGDLVDGGTYDVEAIFDPDDDLDDLVGVKEQITITYPLASGETSAGTEVFQGYINNWSTSFPLEDKMTCSFSIKIASEPTHTDGA